MVSGIETQNILRQKICKSQIKFVSLQKIRNYDGNRQTH